MAPERESFYFQGPNVRGLGRTTRKEQSCGWSPRTTVRVRSYVTRALIQTTGQCSLYDKLGRGRIVDEELHTEEPSSNRVNTRILLYGDPDTVE